jgi:hypothetical protein
LVPLVVEEILEAEQVRVVRRRLTVGTINGRRLGWFRGRGWVLSALNHLVPSGVCSPIEVRGATGKIAPIRRWELKEMCQIIGTRWVGCCAAELLIQVCLNVVLKELV